MLINIDGTLFNQDKILSFDIFNDTDNVNDKVFLRLTFSSPEIVHKEFEIVSFRNVTDWKQYEEKERLRDFLCNYFGKRGIKLTLNDPNKIGCNYYS